MTRPLCRLTDIPDGASRGFPPPPGGFIGLFAVRRGDQAHVYVNSCPHIGVALDWAPDDFLTRDRANIVCATHGALFAIETGLCIQGPCIGDHLERVPVTIEDGWILVPNDAGL
jgi:nitrite reductase/ring-hydroxylating ferredoxin subunit